MMDDNKKEIKGKEKIKTGLSFASENKVKIIIIVLLIVAVLCGVYLFNSVDNGLDKNAVMATSDNLSQEEIKKQMENKADKDLIVATMNITPSFEAKDSEGNLNIEISPRNYYAMRVEITLDKDNTLLYKSGKIDPGYMVKEAKLDKKLEKGTYLCTATFIALDDKDEEVKRASAQIQIEIKK